MLTRPAAPPSAGETQRPPIELMIGSLPAQHREILLATYFRGRTTREAAAALGLTPATVASRLHHAMRCLTALLAAHRPDHAALP